MKCHGCGRQLPFIGNYCPYCGSEIHDFNDPSAISVSTESFDFRIDPEGAILLKYKSDKHENIILPQSINGYRVTAIGERCFSETKVLRAVKTSQWIKRIACAAFSGSSVTFVYLNDGLENLSVSVNGETAREGAFSKSALRGVRLPPSLVSIGERCFENCKLEGIFIPRGIKTIPEQCFNQCKHLKYVLLPSSVEKIEFNAFSQIQAEFVFIPGSIKALHGYAFDGCDNLVDVVVGEGTEELQKNSFCECGKVKRIFLPKSVQRLEYNLCTAGSTVYAKGSWHGRYGWSPEIIYKKNGGVRFFCYEGSIAEKSAIDHGYEYASWSGFHATPEELERVAEPLRTAMAENERKIRELLSEKEKLVREKDILTDGEKKHLAEMDNLRLLISAKTKLGFFDFKEKSRLKKEIRISGEKVEATDAAAKKERLERDSSYDIRIRELDRQSQVLRTQCSMLNKRIMLLES